MRASRGGFELCRPAIVRRLVRFSAPGDQSLAFGSASTVHHIGYAIGTAAVGIAANVAGFCVFAAFIPILGLGLLSAWTFTAASKRLRLSLALSPF